MSPARDIKKPPRNAEERRFGWPSDCHASYPFLRGFASRCEERSWLVPRRGLTVAGTASDFNRTSAELTPTGNMCRQPEATAPTPATQLPARTPRRSVSWWIKPSPDRSVGFMHGQASKAPEDAAAVIEAMEPSWIPEHIRDDPARPLRHGTPCCPVAVRFGFDAGGTVFAGKGGRRTETAKPRVSQNAGSTTPGFRPARPRAQ
jgi:hypothetical protein